MQNATVSAWPWPATEKRPSRESGRAFRTFDGTADITWCLRQSTRDELAAVARQLTGQGTERIVTSMDIESVRRAHEDRLLKLRNVVGVALGERRGVPVIKVYVTHKMPPKELSDQLVPKELEGYPTDVEETGEFTAH